MPEAVARLRALRAVELRSPEWANAAEFYANVWGLAEVERDTSAAWLRGSGPHHHLLQLTAAQRNGLGRISFLLDTQGDVDEAARRLERRRIPILAGPGKLANAGGGYGLQFSDHEGRVIELLANQEAVPAVSQDRPVPVGVTHVVLNTVNIDQSVAFYTTVLGMRVSDWSEHQMAFLRCNADHHSIAFSQAEWASVNHVAYEMRSIDHFMRGTGRVKEQGITPLWGPGRHGPGSNTFGYFGDPAGLVCEYTSDVAQVDEDRWLCRVWRRVPELTDQWGTAGPPGREVRSHMAGVPDHGAFERFPELSSVFASWF